MYSIYIYSASQNNEVRYYELTDSVIHKRDTACSYSSRFKDTSYVKVGLTLPRTSEVEFSRIRPNSPEEVSSAYCGPQRDF